MCRLVPGWGVEFAEVVRGRRMCRDFDGLPVERATVDELLDTARRAPSAGFSQGTGFLVLDEPTDLTRFWDVTLPAGVRKTFGFPGLLRAPVVVIPLAREQTYVDRYAEPDKARAGLGETAAAWTVPYWLVDTSFATMTLLLGAVDAGLGALFYGLDDYGPVCATFGIGPDWQPIGVVAIGHPRVDAALAPVRPVGSAASRPRRAFDDVVRRGSWTR
jgi:nitroreductase